MRHLSMGAMIDIQIEAARHYRPHSWRTPRRGSSRGAWSDAEFFDEHLPDGLVLRALVCLLEGGEWQWTLTVLGEGKGEMISTGTERTATKARRTAAAEIGKCLKYVTPRRRQEGA